ncbi:hypothetical protein AHAS_Ahas14G0114600 [Arachis hypogaea]
MDFENHALISLDSAFLSSLSHALIVVVVSAISDEHTKLIKACHIFRSFPLISFLSDRSLYMSTKNNSSFSDLEKPQGEFDGKACAAIEQSSLISLYDTMFLQLDVTSSQLLVNGFFRDAGFKKQLSDTVHSLLDLRVIPIFNENDAVSTRKAPYEVLGSNYLSVLLEAIDISRLLNLFSFMTSGSLYGALIGSVLAFNVADFLAALLYLVRALVTALAPNLPILVIGRFVYGIGIGLAGYGIGSLLVDTVAGWRYMYGVSSPLAVIMGIGMCWLPASSRWLLLCAIQGKGDGENLKSTAIHCLRRLRGQAVEDSAHRQVDEILAELAYVGEEKEVTFGEMFRGKMLESPYHWCRIGLVSTAQVQFALERGVPAVIGVLGTIKTPYPSAAFDMAHCSRCLIPWGANDGIYTIEVDRALRPGGYWVLLGPPINWKASYRNWQRPKEELEEEQRKIEEVAKLLCWEKKSEEAEIAIWQKTMDTESCRSRQEESGMNFCETTNVNDVWYKKMEACVTRTPKVSGELKPFPERLFATPPRIANGAVPGVSVETFVEDNNKWKRHEEKNAATTLEEEEGRNAKKKEQREDEEGGMRRRIRNNAKRKKEREEFVLVKCVFTRWCNERSFG